MVCPQILGETFAHEASGTASYFYGFWMPAGGNNGVASIETFLTSAASVFTVHLETKSSDEADPATLNSIGSQSINATDPQVWKFDVADAQDLVRYVIACASESDEHLHFQLCQPLWAPN